MPLSPHHQLLLVKLRLASPGGARKGRTPAFALAAFDASRGISLSLQPTTLTTTPCSRRRGRGLVKRNNVYDLPVLTRSTRHRYAAKLRRLPSTKPALAARPDVFVHRTPKLPPSVQRMPASA